MDNHLSPFDVCEQLIGPPPVLSAVCGLDRSASYLWRRASTGRNSGDIPSAGHMRALLDHSEAHGLGLTATHLIRGASAADIQAVLASRSGVPPEVVSRRGPRGRMEAAE